MRAYGELEGVSFSPSPVFAANVLGLAGVEDIISHESKAQLRRMSEARIKSQSMADH